VIFETAAGGGSEPDPGAAIGAGHRREIGCASENASRVEEDRENGGLINDPRGVDLAVLELHREPFHVSQLARRPLDFRGSSGRANDDEVVGRVACVAIAKSIEEDRDALRDAFALVIAGIIDGEPARRAASAERIRAAVLQHEGKPVGAATYATHLAEPELEAGFKTPADVLFLDGPGGAGHIEVRGREPQYLARKPGRPRNPDSAVGLKIGKSDPRRVRSIREADRGGKQEQQVCPHIQHWHIQ
jgi:hypothetical protein